MKFLILFSFFLISFIVKAQDNNHQFQIPQAPIPVEVMVGAKSTMYQITVDKRFVPGSRFKFFNLINYEVDGNEFTPDNYIIQTIGSYEFAKGFDAGIGGNLKAFGGFKPLVSASYSNFTRETNLIINPVFEIHKGGEFSAWGMFEWHPVNEKLLQPFFSLQVLTAWGSQHSYSYHYWRTGLQYKNFRFGPALNVDYLGPNAISKTNLGGFIGVLIQ